jgi:predicted small secreted protein
MRRRIVLVTIVTVVISLLLGGCNTLAGAGRDLEALGGWLATFDEDQRQDSRP